MAEEPAAPAAAAGLGTPIPGEDIPKAVEEAAYKLGWRSKEEFSGEEAEYVDPLTFLVRGSELQRQSSKNVSYLKKTIDDLNSTIDNMKVFNESVYRSELKKLTEQIKELEAEKKEAIKEGNVALVEDIDGKIAEVKNSAPPPPAATKAAANNEVLDAWYEKNPWYKKNEDMARYADSIGDDLALKKVPLPKILEKIEKAVLEMWPEYFGKETKAAPSPVEGGQRRAATATTGKKFTSRNLTDEQLTIGKQFAKYGVMTMDEYIADLAKLGAINE